MKINQSELAAHLGVSKAAVSQWFASKPPADRCPAIERVLKGAVTVEQLRPDVVWQRVPDADWPHPSGRPCIDVEAPPMAAGAQQLVEQAGDAA